MKSIRIIMTALLLTTLGTATAFADVVFSPVRRASSWVVYAVPVAVIIAAAVLLGISVKKRREGRGKDDDRLQ